MVIKNAFVTAAHRIDEELQAFLRGKAEAKVLVFAYELAHMHAVVATDAFQGKPMPDRIREIQEYLQAKIPPDELRFLYKIYAWTAEEYDARVSASAFEGGLTEILNLGERNTSEKQ